LRKMKDSGHDDNTESFRKKQEYYDTLKGIIAELQAAYYFHEDFPKELGKGIDEVTQFQTAIQYPFSPGSGCTASQGTLLRNRIRMAEELVKDMARNICAASHEPGVIVKGDALSFEGWEWHWDYER